MPNQPNKDVAESTIRKRLLTSALLFAVAAVALLPIDVAVADACREKRLPGDLVKLLNFVEVFGHGAGVALILACAVVLDPPRRRGLVPVLICAYGAGLAADAVKLSVERTRPVAFEPGGHVADSFRGWFPARHGTRAWRHTQQSFPSGHTATAAGLAAGLSWLYPHGRRLFAVLAWGVACQRIAATAHFPSDTAAGAALGCAIAAACLGSRWSRRFAGSS